MHRPSAISRPGIRRFVFDLAESGASWSWIALHITVFRTVFDRLCGKSVTRGMVTPKRGLRLPDILNASEAERLVQAGETIRDQLLLGIMYGCGLTGSEAVNLRWRDVLDNGSRLHVEQSTRYRERILSVPEPLQQLLHAGAGTCDPDQYIFRGRSAGRHLSTRMVELVVGRARERADIARPVCVMTLRHSYAVNRLENGVSLPRVQQELGHASIRTTERYTRCLAPTLESHPFATVKRLMQRYEAGNSEQNDARTGLPEISASSPRRPGSQHVGQESVAHSSRLRAKTFNESPTPLASMQSIDIETLHLPFAADSERSTPERFLRLLTTRLVSGILRRRRSRSP